MFKLKIAPPTGPLADALNANARNALPDESGRSGNSRRKKKVEVQSPITLAILELEWAELVKSEWNDSCSFSITGRPADFLLAKNCLTENLVLSTVGPMLELFKYGVAKQFPHLDVDLLKLLTIEDCLMTHVQVDYPFLQDSEAEAIQTCNEFHTHVKVMLDGVEETHSERKNLSAKRLPRVHSCNTKPWAFTFDLPFGTAKVTLARSWSDCPQSFREVDDVEERKKLHALMRHILIVTVQIDLEKFKFNGRTLPQKPTLWTKGNLTQDPFELIWDAVRYETWLNWPLIVRESQVVWDKLSDDEKLVMRAYLGSSCIALRKLEMMQRDGAPGKFRTALINKAFVDIDIPWAILRNNHSQVLGPKLEYEYRFKPQEHPLLAPHTLSRESIEQASVKSAQALAAKASGGRL